MMISTKKYQKMLIIASILLAVFGVYMVYESSNVWAEYKYGDSFYYLKRQFIYFLIGLLCMFIGSKIKINTLKNHCKSFMLLSFFFLILVLIPGIGLVRGGSSSWLGFNSFSFQPSELFKLALIIFFAKYLENNYNKSKKIRSLVAPLIIAILGFVLFMLQPDFGTCMVLALAIFAMVFTSRVPYRFFIGLCSIGLFLVVALIFSASYRFERITAFIDPFSDPLGSGFQIIQSLYAIGPGGLIGRGWGSSYQKYYYLPEPQTDFIFAIVIEEFGLLGGLLILIIYGIIFYSGFKIIKYSKSLFKAYLVLGLLSIFIIQVIINLGVVIGLFPVTGITLPLISYGGSSLCILMFSIGVMNIKEVEDEK